MLTNFLVQFLPVAAFFNCVVKHCKRGCCAGPPVLSRPISSRMWATLSPMAGVGARERSIMPNCVFKRRAASCATSWPTRVILKRRLFNGFGNGANIGAAYGFQRVFYNARAADAYINNAFRFGNAVESTSMKGLSCTALQKITSLAQR